MGPYPKSFNSRLFFQIYRSIVVEIPWQWYLGLVIRSTLAVPPVTAMFLRDESSFFKKLSKLLKYALTNTIFPIIYYTMQIQISSQKNNA